MKTYLISLYRKNRIPLYNWFKLGKTIKSLVPRKLINVNSKDLLNILKIELKKNKNGFIVIGANDGLSFDAIIPDLLKFCQEESLFNIGCFVEPIPFYFNKLVENISLYNKPEKIAFCYNYAIHPKNNTENIYMVKDSYIENNLVPAWAAGLGSFSREHLLKTGRIPKEAIISSVVNCINFDDLISKFYNDSSRRANVEKLKIEYLQIDTEGFDDAIIQMINFDKYNINILKFEQINLSANQLNIVLSKLKIYYHCFSLGEDMLCIRK